MVDAEIEKLQELGRMLPENPRVQLALGKAYLASGNLISAQESLEKAVDLDPENPEAFLKLGNVLAELKDINLAISNYQKAILLDNYYIEAFYCLGMAYIETGNNDEVEKLIERLDQLHPAWANGLRTYAEKFESDKKN